MSRALSGTDNFADQHILVIGDVMLDRYLDGKVNRISPEAPVPVVLLQEEESRLGGAANVAVNLHTLTANPYLLSVIGKDFRGRELLELLPEYHISGGGIVQATDRPTTVKTRVMAGYQHLLRVDSEVTNDISQVIAQQLLESLRDLLDTKPIKAILLQDYNKGVLSPFLIREIMLESIRRDIPVAVDPKRDNFFAYKKCQLFKPNFREIADQLPFGIAPVLEDLDRADEYLRSQLGHRWSLITLSEKGIYWNDGEQSAILPTEARSIADVCGAGDAVFSVAGIGLAAGYGLPRIAELANRAGGVVCAKVGVAPIHLQELHEQSYLAAKS